VIIGAPTIINDDLLRTFNISLVVRGSVTETRTQNSGDSERWALLCWPIAGHSVWILAVADCVAIYQIVLLLILLLLPFMMVMMELLQ
jgi:hypothetical protein